MASSVTQCARNCFNFGEFRHITEILTKKGGISRLNMNKILIR